MPRSVSPPPGHILMGRIGAAHGIKGEVRINSYTADPMAIAAYSPLATDRPGLSVTLSRLRRQGKGLVAALDGVSDRTAAEKLNSVGLYVPRAALPATDPDEFYHADLIGLSARTPAGETLGTVTAVFNHGASDILEITPAARSDTMLVPFSRATVPDIAPDKGYLIVDLPAEAPDDDGEASAK